MFLLRRHNRELQELPHVIFQILLNEGGQELSLEVSQLLETKYSDVPYMEYLDKDDLQRASSFNSLSGYLNKPLNEEKLMAAMKDYFGFDQPVKAGT